MQRFKQLAPTRRGFLGSRPLRHLRVQLRALALILCVALPFSVSAEQLIPMVKASFHWGGTQRVSSTVDWRVGISYPSVFLHDQRSLIDVGPAKMAHSPLQVNLLGQPLDSLLLLARAEQDQGMHPSTKAALTTGAIIAGVVTAAVIVGNKAFEDAGNRLPTGSNNGSNDGGSDDQCSADITLLPPSTNTNDDCD